MSNLKALHIDPQQRAARAQAGLTTGEYSAGAQAHGLATSTGDTSSVGLAGLTLGGGVGWIVRQQGLTIDNVLAVDLVTAEGERIRATADEHPDLFWALRGGGGNFGVATSFDLRLHPTTLVLGGLVLYSAADAVQVIRAATDYARIAADALTIQLVMMLAPPAPFIPPNQHGQLAVAVMFCCTGDMTQAERLVAPLRALATPIGEMVTAMPYPGIFALSEEATVKGAFHDVRSTFLDDFADETIEAIVEHSGRSKQVYPRVQIRVVGGAMARVPRDQTAFAHRDKPLMFSIFNSSPNVSDWRRNETWLAEFWNAIRPKGDGVYVNFLSDEGAGRVRDAYPPETLARLAAVKRQYDPENVFRLNQNIPPGS